jgi:murein L,D-transpeptidase YafK
LLRPLLVAAATAVAAALAGCDTDGTPSVSGRHMQPLSDRMLADIEKRNMTKESPILVRIFKEESELEVWKEDKTGRFALLRTYPICRWSGELGPKTKQGDRQAPEGFYTITPELMNPNSHYYLAINTGFPNAYDRANGRSGEFLMIHGDCLSVGCYAMTDEQIAEIYALARESFFGGQASFQIQAYPFRMTPFNLARHRDSPHTAFWKMLKQGYDHFEVTHLAPKVDICERRYVFDAQSSGEFGASDRCPAYRVPQDIAAAVRNKERRDDIEVAALIKRGMSTVPVTTSGGMHRTFVTAIAQSGQGATIHTAAGTIPSHASPPAETATASVMSFFSQSPPASMQLASAAPASSTGGLLGHLVGSKDADKNAGAHGSRPGDASATKPMPAAATAEPALASRPHPVPPKREADNEPQSAPAATTNMLNGAQPALPAGAFHSRSGG